MPELPEVERVARTLAPIIVGLRVVTADLRRPDIVEGEATAPALLKGAKIARVARHGKQLAILSEDGRALVVQLGMTGQLTARRPGVSGDPQPWPDGDRHVHAIWDLEGGSDEGAVDAAGTRRRAGGRVRMVFRDPRRFGGLTPIGSVEALAARWAELGPDALEVTGAGLWDALRGTRRAVKAALLDQRVVAGVGNIYADEALHAAKIRPSRSARRLGAERAGALAASVRAVLAAAVEAGGSTLRDFVDADGEPGSYRDRHQVYGRGGEACRRCGAPLRSGVIAQRTTVWCPACQK